MKKGFCNEVFLLVLLPAFSLSLQEPCTYSRGYCRMAVYQNNTQNVFEISCYCKYDQDVYENLESVVNLECPIFPRDNSSKMDQSRLIISGCSIRQKAIPIELVEYLQRSKHFEIQILASSYLKMPRNLGKSRADRITAFFKNSKLSGIPEGIFDAVSELKLTSRSSQLGVLEPNAFSGYRQNSSFFIMLDTGSEVTAIGMKAFQLPPDGVLIFNSSRIEAWNKYGYSGGSKLRILNSNINNMDSNAINFFGLQKLVIFNCTIAQAKEEMLNSFPMEKTWTQQSRELSIEVSQNRIMAIQGDSFSHLCGEKKLTFRDNTILQVFRPPINLEDANCQSTRDSRTFYAVSNNRVSCLKCSDFAGIENQNCQLYQNGQCVECHDFQDNCFKPILEHLEENCQEEYKSIAKTCSKLDSYLRNGFPVVSPYIPIVFLCITEIVYFVF